MSEITVKDLLKVAQDKRRQIMNNRIDATNRLAELEAKKRSLSYDDLNNMSAYDYVKLNEEIDALKKCELLLGYNHNGAEEVTDVLIEFIIENGLYEAKIFVEGE